ncbi:MAG: phospho-N-acetylmuramoyl-pentapeptide-transferase [Clostridiales Family XIII bacterium]|jgi:phospho-N-acetylmuramoyl-pentapeptide-transferase|nr:phospho-N-acetylmuramoyl-pentapeptide-transferase [Clostridiales Family XIII bacterium]
MSDLGFALALDFLIPLSVALCVTAVVTRALIPFFRRMKTTQIIHEDVPDAHRQKEGTPTMGGAAILAGLISGCAAAMISARFSVDTAVILTVALIFGFVGFLDDYTKVTRRRNLGLTAKQKIALQLFVALGVALYCVYVADTGTEILIPFLWTRVDIGLWIIPYIIFIVVSMVNSVNLTDGLDGLAGGVTTVLSLFYPVLAILAMTLTEVRVPDDLQVFVITDHLLDTTFFSALAGACIGFLIYNRHPARIFMGDTGSLAIGGGIATAALLLGMELFLPIMGLIFVVEALSDIIQVASYKLRKGKRVFKMAPLHHHFELSGWSEQRVVGVFIGVTFLLGAVSVAVMALQLSM